MRFSWPALNKIWPAEALSSRRVEVPEELKAVKPLERGLSYLDLMRRGWRFKPYRRFDTSRRAVLGTMFAVATVTAADAAPGGRMRFGRTNGSPPPVTVFAPTAQWGVTGVAGSGFDGANPAAPSDPVRTGSKTLLRPLFMDKVTVADDYTFVWDAAAYFGTAGTTGIDTFVACIEGTFVTLPPPSFFTYTAHGTVYSVWGWGVELDYAATMAINATGTMNMYVTATPKDTAIQPTTMGPYTIYARAPGVGVNKQFDYQVSLNPSAGNNPSVSYNTLVGALNYMQSVSAQRAHVVCVTDNVQYSVNGEVSPNRNFAMSWATISCAPGVTALWGAYDVTGYVILRYDGLHFSGTGHKFRWVAMSNGFGSLMTSTSNSYNMFAFDGIDLTGGDPGSIVGMTGSGQTLLSYGAQPSSYFIGLTNNSQPFNLYFMHVTAHDLPGYGFANARLILNCSLKRVSGTGCENNLGAIQGLDISEIGGVQSGLRSQHPAFDITAPAGCKIRKTSQNGNNGFFQGLDASNTVLWSFPVNSPGNSSNTTVAQVIADINSRWTGWTAANTGTPGLNATFLSMADLKPSYAIGLPTDLNAYDATPRPVGAGLSLTTIADIHSNGMVWDQITNAVNFISRFINAYNISGSSSFAANGVKDFAMLSSSFQDVSGVGNAQPLYLSGANDHVILQYVTIVGVGNNLNLGTVFGTKSVIENCAMEQVSWSGTPSAGMNFNGLCQRVGSTPAGNQTNCKTLSGAAESTMYANPTAIPPNLTALAPLLLPNGTTVAGCFNQAGVVQLAV